MTFLINPFKAGTNEIPFAIQAVDFDATNDYMSRSALSGASDGPNGAIFFWLRLDGGDGNSLTIIGGDLGGSVRVTRTAVIGPQNVLSVTVTNSGGSSGFDLRSDGTPYDASPTWHPVFISWQTNAAAGAKVGRLYVGDADVEGYRNDASASFSVNLSQSTWMVGARTNLAFPPPPVVGSRLNGCLAELMIWQEYIDWSVEGNRRKLLSGSGKPVDPGSDGSLVTGTAPLVYLSVRPTDTATAFGTNRGTGGNFSITGTLDIASSSPSD